MTKVQHIKGWTVKHYVEHYSVAINWATSHCYCRLGQEWTGRDNYTKPTDRIIAQVASLVRDADADDAADDDADDDDDDDDDASRR